MFNLLFLMLSASRTCSTANNGAKSSRYWATFSRSALKMSTSSMNERVGANIFSTLLQRIVGSWKGSEKNGYRKRFESVPSANYWLSSRHWPRSGDEVCAISDRVSGPDRPLVPLPGRPRPVCRSFHGRYQSRQMFPAGCRSLWKTILTSSPRFQKNEERVCLALRQVWWSVRVVREGCWYILCGNTWTVKKSIFENMKISENFQFRVGMYGVIRCEEALKLWKSV